MARPKGSKNKSKNIAKETRDHQTNIAIINAFARDPELKYFLGMASGAGVGWVGSLFSQHGVSFPGMPPGPSGDENETLSKLRMLPYGYLVVQRFGSLKGAVTPIALYDMYQAHQALDQGFGSGNGLGAQMGNILKMGGYGFASTCAMILVLRSIFSGTDLGELLSGVGEIVPL